MSTRIYALRDGHWIRYVGKTYRSLEARFADHLADARNGEFSHKANGICKILREGRLPHITLIEIVNGDGCEEEIAWIKYFRDAGIDLWNEADGGQGGAAHRGHKHCLIAKRKMSFAHKGHKQNTPEVRKRISNALKGRVKSLEVRKRMSIAQKGRFVSEEAKEKNRRAHIGKKASAETRLKMSRSQKKVFHPPCSFEHKLKLSTARKGIPWTAARWKAQRNKHHV